ncbi:hypothetical protein [Xanthomarina gelatinilytica]|uniref:hypothetical protein n=1 Tax=Xanthomarina gelatinilytica TaxID=1137281 RepID=UPI003AA7F436
MLKIKYLYSVIAFQVLLTSPLYSQKKEILIKNNFAIRDFYLDNDSLFFIKKRDIYLYNLKSHTSKNYFIGGYGLKLYNLKNKNVIVSASNELVRNVSSVRFYNKSTNKFDDVFYFKDGKILDFLLIPESKLFVLSLTNKKIIFIDYREKPKFYKTIELNLNALSRRLIYKNNILYFVTDIAEIYEYDFFNYKKTLIYDAGELITDFVIDQNTLVYSTIKGHLVKINLLSKTKNEIEINNNFVNVIMDFDEKYLICGSWNGTMYILNKESFSIDKELNIHKRAVLQIKKGKNNTIYSSSLDKTIMSWELK